MAVRNNGAKSKVVMAEPPASARSFALGLPRGPAPLHSAETPTGRPGHFRNGKRRSPVQEGGAQEVQRSSGLLLQSQSSELLVELCHLPAAVDDAVLPG